MIRSVVVFLIACHQVSTLGFLYSELEHLGGSCYPRDSCAPPRENDEDHLWGNKTCECGAHCIRYGTCCADSPHLGKTLQLAYRGEVCQKLSPFQDAIVAVSRCSETTRCGRQILEKCERTDIHPEDPVVMAPVTSLATHVTYKNYFCALCNDDARVVYIWDIALGTRESVPGLSNVTEQDFLGNLAYSDERKAWGVTKRDSFYEVKMQFKLPTSLRKLVKKCYPNMVSQCDGGRDFDSELRYRCSSYYAPIKLKVDKRHAKKFRNIHCAICNGVNLSQTGGTICKLDIGGRKAKPSFSFALLLDINRSDGDLVGKKQICKDSETWDPFFKKCRYLACGLPGYVLKEGKCAKN